MQIFDRTGLYKLRMPVVLDGYVYLVGDFTLRLGRVAASSRLLGVTLEVEYMPLSTQNLAKQALDDFSACIHRATCALAGSFSVVEEPRFADYGLSAHECTGRHSALALVHVLGALSGRKETGAAVSTA